MKSIVLAKNTPKIKKGLVVLELTKNSVHRQAAGAKQ